jgi:isoleucyl-tRNA synthetase
MDYGIFRELETGEMLIVAEKLATQVLTNLQVKKIASIKGLDLLGLEYTPIFEVPLGNLQQKSNIYKIYNADFVSDTDGTGAVHIAPAYGDTDFELGNTLSLPVLYSLDANGELLPNLGGELNTIAGSYFLKANKQIIALLVENGKIYKVFSHLHKSPYYERDGKAVYYCAQDGWFIAESKIKPHSLALNGQINWNPKSFKDGRFGKGLETAPDWCISRKRYWGNPIPIWQTGDKNKTIFVQSVEELRRQAVNPIYRILVDKEFFPELYVLGKIVIFTDGSEKIPLGINAVQHRSRNLQALKEKSTSNLQEFAIVAQPLLDEILSLFGKYNDIQIMLSPEEQRMWTTWLGTLHPKSKKSTKIFYFYQRLKEQDDELIPTGVVLALDLHKPYIDDIILRDNFGNLYFRIDEVLDCWVESGSMPFASLHYPFENKELVERNFSADWICEAQDQTRGWFRTLHVLASGIFGQVAFKNINTTGLILAQDGKKMSKSKMNYTDPMILLEKFGSDAVRNYLLSSVLLDAESFSFKDKDLETVFRDTTLMLSNTIKYASFVFETNIPTLTTKGYKHPLNQWWKAYTQNYANKIVELMDKYEINDASRLIVPYIQNLSTWYIRRSKDILEDHGGEVASCLRETLKMFAKVTACLQPFNAEKIWSVVAEEEDFESVHLTDISGITWNINTDILEQMEELKVVASSIHSSRKAKNIRVRQPLEAYLQEFVISKFGDNHLWLDILTKECNLLAASNMDSEKYNYDGKFGKMSVNLEVNRKLSILGFARDFERAVQDFRKKQGYKSGQLIYTKWFLASTKDDGLFREVMGQTDWAKLKLEVKWSDKAPEDIEKTIEVKDLMVIIIC